MYKFLLLLLLSISFASCINTEQDNPEIEDLNELDCSSFVNGQFVYPNHPGTEVTRKDSVQVEANHPKNYVDTYKIVWTGECEYYLVLTNSTDTLFPLWLTDTIFTTITNTTDSSYKYRATAKGKTINGELIKVDD